MGLNRASPLVLFDFLEGSFRLVLSPKGFVILPQRTLPWVSITLPHHEIPPDVDYSCYRDKMVP